MNKIRYSLLASIFSVSFCLNSGLAEAAAPVTASADIDWSKLQLSFTSVGDSASGATFSNYNTSLNSFASSSETNENNSTSITNWTDAGDTAAEAGSGYANSLASSTDFSGNAVSGEGGYVSSSGYRALDFAVDGPGVLTVTVPYTLSLTGEASDCYYCYNFDHASVSGNASFYSYTGSAEANSSSSTSFFLTDDYWNPSAASQSGTLVFGIFTSGPGNGSIRAGFDLSTQGVSVVPEPGSYAMLLAGLGIVGAIIRRRKNLNA